MYIAFFLVSAALGALQILEMRILSFSAWHYFAYIIIALAITGSAAAGAFFPVKNIKSGDLRRFLSIFSLVFGAAVFLSVYLISKIRLDALMSDIIAQTAALAAGSAALSVPSFCLGAVSVCIYSAFKDKIHRFYAVSLTGGAIGSLAALPLIDFCGAEAATFVIAFMPFAAAFLFADNKSKSLRFLSAGASVLFILCAVFISGEILEFRPAGSKILAGLLRDHMAKIESSRWDRNGRVDVTVSDKPFNLFNYFPGIKSSVVTIDGDAFSFVYDFGEKNQALGGSLPSVSYYGLESPDVLCIGMSSTEIGLASLAGAKHLDIVEVNRSMVDLVEAKYSEFKENLLKKCGVSVYNDEARRYLANSEKKYDLIKIPGDETWAGMNGGAYIFNESYLYTVEAIESYLDHLTGEGTLSFMTRIFWPPRETMRLVTEISAVLRSMGITNPGRHIMIASDGVLASVSVKKRPFTWAELDTFYELTLGTDNVRIVYAPGFSANEAYFAPVFQGVNFSAEAGRLLLSQSFDLFFEMAAQGQAGQFVDNYKYDISPATDDRPYFSNFFRVGETPVDNGLMESRHNDYSFFAIVLIVVSVILLFVFGISLIVSSSLLSELKNLKKDSAAAFALFSMLGAGFVFLEIPLIQQFALIWGDIPGAVAATTAVLLPMCGAGSLLSGRSLDLMRRKPASAALLLFVPLLVFSYAFAIPCAASYFIALSFVPKLLLTALFLLPVGLVAGQLFPISLKIYGKKSEKFIPWCYCADGVASILATFFSLIISMICGFQGVVIISALCYFAAALIIWKAALKS